MRLRSLTKNIREQNWFAVFIDFFIVVVGVFIGIQVANWNNDRERQISENEYLKRLHSDVVELTDRRELYDTSRPNIVGRLEMITDFANGDTDDLSDLNALFVNLFETTFAQRTQEFAAMGLELEMVADSYICNTIDWSSSLTIPPSELPTASELTYSGKLERIASDKVKGALLSYLQQASRAETLISRIQDNALKLSLQFPDLFQIRYPKGMDLAVRDEESYPLYQCDFDRMRKNNAFLNALNLNRSNYSEYTNRGVIPTSKSLSELHKAIDDALGISHSN